MIQLFQADVLGKQIQYFVCKDFADTEHFLSVELVVYERNF